METTCHRCHQTVEPDKGFCPTCGMPQLLYSADAVPGQAPPERWNEPIRDASIVDWKRGNARCIDHGRARRHSLLSFLAVSIFGLIWMSVAAAWAVALYLRSQRPAWITTGAVRALVL